MSRCNCIYDGGDGRIRAPGMIWECPKSAQCALLKRMREREQFRSMLREHLDRASSGPAPTTDPSKEG